MVNIIADEDLAIEEEGDAEDEIGGEDDLN